MGKLLIFLGFLGIIAGVLIGVVGPFMGGFGFGGLNDFIESAAGGEATAAQLCREGETLETDQGASTFTQGQGWARSTRYFCVNSDGVRRDVTGEFVEGLFGGVSSMLPGLLGGIGLSALLSTCGTGLLVLGFVVTILRGRRAPQVMTAQDYGIRSSPTAKRQNLPRSTDLNTLVANALAGKETPGVTVVSTSTVSGEGDLTTRLEGLKTALDKKLITQEEYDRLRKAILDQT